MKPPHFVKKKENHVSVNNCYFK